ncbi:STAS domain-containing protein [Rhodopila globiformis]|uniref:Anti-anti-sigma factor n=1 Tax=Rhodopila globiformis TaxID=1071 RepID=A0A2S6MV41_RHOGL|nr:STAS domain-containing protein [Rhodopila globiformis]PPQ26231.1 anti-anti-sigma factor [Rhodopila globiformis]
MRFDYDAGSGCFAMTGEFTFADHPIFQGVLTQIGDGRDRSIVFDVSGLSFIDSAGLGMLILAREEARKLGSTIRLRGPRGQVKRILAVTKFDALFPVEA